MDTFCLPNSAINISAVSQNFFWNSIFAVTRAGIFASQTKTITW
jgi:hypothetical protein